MPKNTFSQEELLNMDPQELLAWLASQFIIDMPITADNPEALKEAGRLLGVFAGNYAYLSNMAIMAKLRKRQLKRDGKAKPIIEDALSREEIFDHFADITKTSYNTVSRMITVRQMEMAEMKMADGRYG